MLVDQRFSFSPPNTSCPSLEVALVGPFQLMLLNELAGIVARETNNFQLIRQSQ